MKLFGYEIIIKKARNKKASYSRRQWTKSETDMALRLRNEGKTTQEIAFMLNRTPQSVNSRLWKVRREK